MKLIKHSPKVVRKQMPTLSKKSQTHHTLTLITIIKSHHPVILESRTKAIRVEIFSLKRVYKVIHQTMDNWQFTS